MSLILETGALRAVHIDAAGAIRSASSKESLLRARLERSSNFDFVDDLRSQLIDEGLAPGVTENVLADVMLRPRLTAELPSPSKQSSRILQAKMLTDTCQGGLLLVAFQVTVAAGKPPVVTTTTAETWSVDVTKTEDVADVVRLLEAWWAEYRVRSRSAPPVSLPDPLLWLGDPTRGGYRKVPPDWKPRVVALGSVLGIDVMIPASPAAARAQNLAERGRIAVVVRDNTDWSDLENGLSTRNAEVLRVGNPGTDFADLIGAARESLLTLVLATVSGSRQTWRELQPGESVYHRKVGDSKGSYDSFDAGSPTPCSHGADGFERFGSADKARKGMRRLYADFEDSWLYHCGKFPNCGMYCARRPAK